MIKGLWVGEMTYYKLEDLLKPDLIALKIFEETQQGDVKAFFYLGGQAGRSSESNQEICEKLLMEGKTLWVMLPDGREEMVLQLRGKERSGKAIALALKMGEDRSLKGELSYIDGLTAKAKLLLRMVVESKT